MNLPRQKARRFSLHIVLLGPETFHSCSLVFTYSGGIFPYIIFLPKRQS